MAASGPASMAGVGYGAFPDDNPDDLPRTFRREKEARAREAREREAKERAASPSLPLGPELRPSAEPQMFARADAQPALADTFTSATVRRIDVPFPDLMIFFLKAVIAAIPALVLLGVVLWLMGAAVHVLLPGLFKMKILIGFGS